MTFLVWMLAATAPLGPQSKHSVLERDRAVWAGLDFIAGMAESDEVFAVHASELLWACDVIAQTSADPALAVRARNYGRRLAERWRAAHPTLPINASADKVWDLATTAMISKNLGVHHDRLLAEVDAALSQFDTETWLEFEPRRGPPPTRVYRASAERTRRYVDLDVFYDALITAYFGDALGFTFGARFDEVAAWRPQLYPYPSKDELGESAYNDLTYVVTHLVYTANGYGQRAIDPLDYPDEMQFLLQSFDDALAAGDGETFAEYVDSLKSFGFTPASLPAMAVAIERLLDSQNADGSWGDPRSTDHYTRYHTTLTAIEALRDFRAFP